jgi:hypothetical protein
MTRLMQRGRSNTESLAFAALRRAEEGSKAAEQKLLFHLYDCEQMLST